MKSKAVKIEGKTFLVHSRTEEGLKKAIKDLKKIVKERPNIDDEWQDLEGDVQTEA